MVSQTVNVESRFKFAYDQNVKGVRASLDHMPASGYKAYCQWVLDSPALADRWLQLMGIESLIRLTGGLLDGLLTDAEWMQLVHYSVPINISQMYEVVSDNLAIGLGVRREGDLTFATRSQLVYTFNQATIERLRGRDRQSVHEHLNTLLPLMRKISTFEQSLSPEKHRQLASEFVREQLGSNIVELEYALHPLLIGNLETCIDLTKVLEGTASHKLLIDGLIRRYQGVNDLLERSALSFDELLDISTNTIMVVPTLAYYAGVLAEKVQPLRPYPLLLGDGTALRAFEDAALLVRLLNDMGTLLLEHDPAERRTFIRSLHKLNKLERFPTFDQLMLAVTGAQGILLTRIRKDVQFGEFNTAMYPVRAMSDVTFAIDLFAEQLEKLALVYQQRLARLTQTCAEMTQRLNSPLVSDLVLRFVHFHRKIYSRSFETAQGEYAV